MAACASSAPHTISAASAQPSPRSPHRSPAADAKYFYPPLPCHDADQQNSAPYPARKPSQKSPHPSRPESPSPHPASTNTTAPPSHPLPHQTPYKTLPPAMSSPAKQNPKSPAPPPR